MSAVTTSSAPSAPGHTAWVGVAAAVGGSALAAYSAYGDPHTKSNQESAVPFLVGLSLLVAVLTFALVVPRMARVGASRFWTMGTAVLALALTPVAFWSGVPLVLGVASGLGGRRASSRATVVLGAVSIVGSVAMAVLGNTVLSSS